MPSLRKALDQRCFQQAASRPIMSTVSISKYQESSNILGLERFTSDSRQLGALMMIFGMCCLVFPQVRNARLSDREVENTNMEFFLLVGGVIQTVFGAFALIVGFLATVHDYGSLFLTRTLIVFTQLAWIPFVTDLAHNIEQTSQGFYSGYIPHSYDPTTQDVRFVGAMGFVGILGWYTGLFGSLLLTQFTLHAFQSGNPESRNRAYYQTRYIFYSTVFLLAGASQMLLGVYVMKEFGSGPLARPISVAMYVVMYPEVSIGVGALQASTALYGFVRASGVTATPDNHVYQCIIWLCWLVTIGGTAMAQVYSLSDGMGAGRAPSLIVLTLSLHLLLSFLDFKMRTIPYQFPVEYYFTPVTERDLESVGKGEPETESDKSEGGGEFAN